MKRRRRKPGAVLPDDVLPCVWMSAGLITYKLCDRAFECESCPLDAALRGEPRPSQKEATAQATTDWVFPDDRYYTPRHAWLRRADEAEDGRGHARFVVGLDAFAVQLLRTMGGIAAERLDEALIRGAIVCEIMIDGGSVPLRMPLSGTVVELNPRLQSDPEVVLRAPYHEGWLLNIVADEARRREEIAHLLSAEGIRDKVRLDLRRFRRQVAMRLLSATYGGVPVMADGGERITDLPQMLGGASYRSLVADLLG